MSSDPFLTPHNPISPSPSSLFSLRIPADLQESVFLAGLSDCLSLTPWPPIHLREQ